MHRGHEWANCKLNEKKNKEENNNTSEEELFYHKLESEECESDSSNNSLPPSPMTCYGDSGNMSESNKEFQEICKKSKNSEPTLKMNDIFEYSSNEQSTADNESMPSLLLHHQNYLDSDTSSNQSLLPPSGLSNRFKLESTTTNGIGNARN